MSQARISQLHAVDHLNRISATSQPSAAVVRGLADPRLDDARELSVRILNTAHEGLTKPADDGWIQHVGKRAGELSAVRRRDRPVVLEQTAAGGWNATTAPEVLDAMRWLDTLGYHAWRISNHLGGGTGGAARTSRIPAPVEAANEMHIFSTTRSPGGSPDTVNAMRVVHGSGGIQPVAHSRPHPHPRHRRHTR